MKRLFKISRLLHKVLGLLVLVVLVMMSATGTLLNHPAFLTDWDLPQWVLGESYRYKNWNRFSIRDGLVLEDGTVIIGGKLGVFIGTMGQGPLKPLNNGLPDSLFLRDTYSLLAVTRNESTNLYAGTRGGLYSQNLGDKEWKRVSTPTGNEHIVDLISIDDKILAFTPFGCLVSPAGMTEPAFQKRPVPFLKTNRKIPGYRLLFPLHSGRLFGTAGRFLVDVVALGLLFLCLTAFYIWIFGKRGRLFNRKAAKSLFAFSFRNHLNIGVWLSIPLFIVVISGTFIRPPLIILAKSLEVPLAWLGREAHEILKAEISDNDTLIVATRSGWYRGKGDLNLPLEPFMPPFPVFGMGPTILERLSDNSLLVGSFSGLFYWKSMDDHDIVVDLQGRPVAEMDTMRPGEIMAAGALIRDGDLLGYADYRKGIQKVDNILLPLHDIQLEESFSGRISLYHFLFELHNGRILRDLIGRWYILFIPLIGIFSTLVIATGIFDWCWRKAKICIFFSAKRI